MFDFDVVTGPSSPTCCGRNAETAPEAPAARHAADVSELPADLPVTPAGCPDAARPSVGP
jgi:hypothetical protein